MNSLITLKSVVTKKQVVFEKDTYVVEQLVSYDRCSDNVRVTWIRCSTKADACFLREFICKSGVDAYVSNTSVCAENCEIMEVVY